MPTPTRPYAYDTSVSVDKTQGEIKALAAKYGASSFMAGHEGDLHAIMFTVDGRRVRFVLHRPTPTDRLVSHRLDGRAWPPASIPDRVEAEERRRWRTLLLAIKAKLDVVHSGIFSFQDEFMSFIVLPNGSTVAEQVGPAIEEAYATGEMPSILGLPLHTSQPALPAGD